MNVQAPSTNPMMISASEEVGTIHNKPKGKLVLPTERRDSKEYPKEKFYALKKQQQEDKLLNMQFGDLQLNNNKEDDDDDEHFEPSCGADSLTKQQMNNSFEAYDFHPSCGTLNNSFGNLTRTSASSFGNNPELPKILEGKSSHEALPHNTIFPDITKYWDSDTSDDSEEEEEDFATEEDVLADLPEREYSMPTKEEDGVVPSPNRLGGLGSNSSHSLYETRDSSDDGSDWEVDSDDQSLGLEEEEDNNNLEKPPEPLRLASTQKHHSQDSLYERRNSSDDGSAFEVDSNDTGSLGSC